MARPPKTTAQHIKDGTYQPCRHSRRVDAIIQNSDMPPPPEELGEYGKEMWLDVCESLPKEVLVKIDVFQLLGMCEWWQQWRELQKAIATCNDVLDPTYYKLNQMTAVVWKHFAAASSRFGMTPSDRAKIKITEKEKDDGDPLTLLKMRRQGTA